MSTTLVPALILVTLATLPAFAGGPEPSAMSGFPLLDTAAPWERLELRARKFIFSATVRVSLESRSAGQALEEIVADGGDLEGLLPTGGSVDRIHTVSRMPGKTEVADTWIDAATGAVLQTTKETHGKSNYWKLRRYYRYGYHEIREAPSDSKERKARRRHWTKHEELMVRWDPPPPEGAVVTSSYATIYLLSRGGSSLEGRTRRWFISAREKLVEIHAVPGPRELIKVAIRQSWPGGSEELDCKLEAPTIRMVPRWYDGRAGEAASTGFMGIQGAAHIALLPDTGIPVLIDGHVKSAGHVTSRLIAVRWK